MGVDRFTVAVAVNDTDVLERNLWSSPGVRNGSRCQLLLKEGYSSASVAYNAALDEAEEDVLIFVHQDVYLPEGWFSNVGSILCHLEKEGINWRVLGCFGSAKGRPGGVGRVYTTGMGLHGNEISKPEPVETSATSACAKPWCASCFPIRSSFASVLRIYSSVFF